MPIVPNCCKCISLKTGTIITGALGMVFEIIGFILIISNAVKVKTILFVDMSPLLIKIGASINVVLTLVISILLIYGAVKSKRWFMLPWIVIAITHDVGVGISIIYSTVEFFKNDDITAGCVTIILGPPFLAFLLYLWLVVFSYYQLVGEEKNRGPYGRPLYR